MANVLKRITTRAKQLRKRYPKKKYVTLQRQAAREVKAGKKPRKKRATTRKAAPRKRKAAARKVVRRRRPARAARPKVIRRRTVVVYRTKKAKRRSSVSGFSMKKAMPVLLIGGAIALGLALTKKSPPPIIQTSNPVRNQNASDILLYAQAASMTATAIANLIKSINSSSDAQVQQMVDNVKNGVPVNTNIAGMRNRPSLVRSMQ